MAADIRVAETEDRLSIGEWLQTAIRLMRMAAHMDLMWLLRDTRTCLLVLTTDLVTTLAGLAGILLLSVRFDGIGGMSGDQVLFMLGYATCVDGLFMMFFAMNNTGHISRVIGRGQFDHMLVQPVPLPLQLFTSGFIPFTGSTPMLCGLGLTGYAAAKLGLWANPSWIPGFLLALPVSLAIILACSFLIGSSAFYAPKAAEEVCSSVNEFFQSTKQFPLGGLPQVMQIVFCTVLPAGLAAWLPASRILGLPTSGFPIWFLLIAATTLGTAATLVFRKGLRHYAKFGSQRYSDHGHRR